MVLIEVGNSISSKPLHPLKVEGAMWAMPSGMRKVVRPLQSHKAYSPIESTLAGNTSSVSELQPEKA